MYCKNPSRYEAIQKAMDSGQFYYWQGMLGRPHVEFLKPPRYFGKLYFIDTNRLTIEEVEKD